MRPEGASERRFPDFRIPMAVRVAERSPHRHEFLYGLPKGLLEIQGHRHPAPTATDRDDLRHN